MNKIKQFALFAIVSVAATFTFNCSSDDGDEGGSSGSIESVTIGSQVWMKKNLDVNVDGSYCYQGTDNINDDYICYGKNKQVVNCEDYDAVEDYEYKPSAETQANCNKYGRLYSWAMALDLPLSCNSSVCADQVKAKHQGICPKGWHVPSYEDWIALRDYVETNNGGCTDCAGKYLKATSGWDDYKGVSGNGLDSYKFNAIPGGGVQGGFTGKGSIGVWWSSQERIGSSASKAATEAQLFIMGSSGDKLDGEDPGKNVLASVRCVKD